MLTKQTLIDDLARGCKPKDQFRVGLEHEQFTYNIETGAPLPYDGAPGIKQLLDAIADTYGWEKISENGNVVALKKDGDNITLEPGGQFEYSGGPKKNTREAKIAMDAFYQDINSVAEKLGVGFLTKGFHPTWKLEEIHQMPKPRYDIMAPYMDKIKSLGRNMMFRACTAQVNLDFSSEDEMVKNLRMSLAIQPAVIALMANSSMVEGKDSGYVSYRSHMWNNVDPDRCGILPFAFEDGMGFARYVEHALEVPMYFIYRDGHYIDVSGLSFYDYMEGKLPGHEGEYPTMQDWQDHLTTLFPEVRLKHFLELRGADCHDLEMVYAMSAFWEGLFYNSAAGDAAWDLVKDWSVDDHQMIRNTVPKMGFNTPTPDGRDLAALAKNVLDILSDDFLDPFEKVLTAHKA